LFVPRVNYAFYISQKTLLHVSPYLFLHSYDSPPSAHSGLQAKAAVEAQRAKAEAAAKAKIDAELLAERRRLESGQWRNDAGAWSDGSDRGAINHAG
jgi:hypothetical protein